MDAMAESFIRNGIFYTTAIARLCNSLLIKALFDSLSSSAVLCLGQSLLVFCTLDREREKSQEEWRLK